MLQQLADQKSEERKLEEELLRKKGDLISVSFFQFFLLNHNGKNAEVKKSR